MRCRIPETGEFRGDLGPLAALFVELARKLIGVRSLLVRATLAVLGRLGIVLRVQQGIVDFPSSNSPT